MGGHHEPFKVPDPSKYTNWQKIPELVQYNKKLAQLGLTDPFIRNYFHKFDPDSGAYAGPVRRSKMLTYMNVLRPGFITGFISAALLIAIEETYTYYNYGYTSWTQKKH